MVSERGIKLRDAEQRIHNIVERFPVAGAVSFCNKVPCVEDYLCPGTDDEIYNFSVYIGIASTVSINYELH